MWQQRREGEKKKGGRNGGWRRQGEEKRDPPVVEVAPATSWRGRTRPTIPKKLEAEERRATLESLALSGVSPSKSRSIDLEIPLESRRADPRSRCQRDRHWISYNELPPGTLPFFPSPRLLSPFFFFSFSFHRAKKRFLDQFERRERFFQRLISGEFEFFFLFFFLLIFKTRI